MRDAPTRPLPPVIVRPTVRMVRCPHCGAALKVDGEAKIGEMAECAACAAYFILERIVPPVR